MRNEMRSDNTIHVFYCSNSCMIMIMMMTMQLLCNLSFLLIFRGSQRQLSKTIEDFEITIVQIYYRAFIYAENEKSTTIWSALIE